MNMSTTKKFYPNCRSLTTTRAKLHEELVNLFDDDDEGLLISFKPEDIVDEVMQTYINDYADFLVEVSGRGENFTADQFIKLHERTLANIHKSMECKVTTPTGSNH